MPDTSPGLVPPGLPPRGAVAMDLSRHVSGDLWVVRLDKLSDHQAVVFTFDGFGSSHSSEHFVKPKMLHMCPASLDRDIWRRPS